MERTKNVEIFERLLKTAIFSKETTRHRNWDNFFNFREKHEDLKKLVLFIGVDSENTPQAKYRKIDTVDETGVLN